MDFKNIIIISLFVAIILFPWFDSYMRGYYREGGDHVVFCDLDDNTVQVSTREISRTETQIIVECIYLPELNEFPND